MATKTLTKQAFRTFVDSLIKAIATFGPVRRDPRFVFAKLDNADDVAMDYDVSLRSPKVFFQPPQETLVEFNLKAAPQAKPVLDTTPFVLLGIHTYDLKALGQMDKVWSEKNPDQHYLARRNAATIVALEPVKASKWSFWASVDGTTVDGGYDLLLTDVGDAYVIEIGTDKGAKLLAAHAKDARDATADDIKKRDAARAKMKDLCAADRKVRTPAKDLPALVKGSYEHAIWEEQAKKCYSCGSCNMVCPTCYCFDVHDDIELDMAHGKRTRNWDGCLLESFAIVAGDENFREHRADRFRHRIFRKFDYLTDKVGDIACVGCGRCSSTCLPDITDPVKILNTIKEGN